MQVEPAHIDQIRRGRDGKLVVISADAGGVASELQRIHPGLRLRYAEAGRPPYWVVFYAHCGPHKEFDQGCSDCRLAVERGHGDFVLSAQQCDHRIVNRVREIDSHGRSGYDFAKEVEAQNVRAREQHRETFREKVGPIGEEAAHALRKDLGVKSRAFVRGM